MSIKRYTAKKAFSVNTKILFIVNDEFYAENIGERYNIYKVSTRRYVGSIFKDKFNDVSKMYRNKPTSNLKEKIKLLNEKN